MKYGIILTSLFFLFLSACRKDPVPVENQETIKADSSGFSVLLVKCRSSDPMATGIAVIDIQKIFLSGKAIKSIVRGKMFSFKTVNEALYQASVEKVVLDLQNNNAYFKNYDSFEAIFSEEFKTQTGFQKSYDLTNQQAEQLFKKQDLILSIGPGSNLRTTAGETFSLAGFVSSMSVGSYVSGGTIVGGSRALKDFFTVGMPDVKNTAISQANLITVSSYGSAGYTGGYTYTYPLPPSPAPMYGAPTWFWEKMTIMEKADPFAVIPSGATPKGVLTSNFSNAQNTMSFKNAKVVGSNLEFEYPATDARAYARLNQAIDLANGFETSFEFSGENVHDLEVQLSPKGESGYQYFGIDALNAVPKVSPILTSYITNNKINSIFDGKNHIVKIIFANRPTIGVQVKIFVDDMSQPKFDGISTLANNTYSYFTTLEGQQDAERYIRLSGWSRSSSGKMTVKNWTFRGL